MEVIQSLNKLVLQPHSAFVTVGVFDGIHRGHSALIETMVNDAQQASAISCVLTFENHPLSLLAPAYCPKRLTTPEQQQNLLRQKSIDLLVRIKFDKKFAQLSPTEFIEKILCGRLGARKIYCSADFHFGQAGSGDVNFLLQHGKKWGLETVVVPPVTLNGCVVSSTLIRELLLAGRIEQANQMLGYLFALEGTVVSGKGLGGKVLHYPTANLDISAELLIPADGVYAVVVTLDDQKYGGMLNIGTCPTFGEHPRSVELHILDYVGDLVGKILRVQFITRLRDELKFSSPGMLRHQLALDEQQTRSIWKKFKDYV
ncbi:MAG: bifunctional riboflavin kinase/FAD synthetase [Candidatus Sumerlaeia bacterium]|nr:bifunctional riboflavin kinase/FAD synthetase [Candidatus Sumerlaeia bacterium]